MPIKRFNNLMLKTSPYFQTFYGLTFVLFTIASIAFIEQTVVIVNRNFNRISTILMSRILHHLFFFQQCFFSKGNYRDFRLPVTQQYFIPQPLNQTLHDGFSLFPTATTQIPCLFSMNTFIIIVLTKFLCNVNIMKRRTSLARMSHPFRVKM